MFRTKKFPPESERKRTFFINRNFAFLWVGHAISVTGDYVFRTMLVLWTTTVLAKGQSWVPLAVSGVLLESSVPTFLLVPAAGVFADRWEKRVIMMRMDMLRALLVMLLILVTIPLPFLADGRLPILWQL